MRAEWAEETAEPRWATEGHDLPKESMDSVARMTRTTIMTSKVAERTWLPGLSATPTTPCTPPVEAASQAGPQSRPRGGGEGSHRPPGLSMRTGWLTRERWERRLLLPGLEGGGGWAAGGRALLGADGHRVIVFSLVKGQRDSTCLLLLMFSSPPTHDLVTSQRPHF